MRLERRGRRGTPRPARCPARSPEPDRVAPSCRIVQDRSASTPRSVSGMPGQYRARCLSRVGRLAGVAAPGTALAIMGSPGPATISLVAAGSAYGVRRSLGYLAGIVAGTAVVLRRGRDRDHGGAAGRAGAAVGAARGRRWRTSSGSPTTSRPRRRSRPDGAPPPPSLAGGALLGVANPKAWVAIAAVFASTRLAGTATADAVAKVAVLTVMIVPDQRRPGCSPVRRSRRSCATRARSRVVNVVARRRARRLDGRLRCLPTEAYTRPGCRTAASRSRSRASASASARPLRFATSPSRSSKASSSRCSARAAAARRRRCG